MSHYRTMRMVVAGAALALAGCVATTPERGGQAPSTNTATRAPTGPGTTSESGAQTVFEARGIAYLGGDFSQTREQAYNESKRRLFDAGATIHLSAVQATTFGTLTTDCAMQIVGGTLLDFKVLEEGIENQSRYFVRSQARFEQREAEKALEEEALKKIGCWSGDDETAGEVAETPASDPPKVATADGTATAKGSAAESGARCRFRPEVQRLWFGRERFVRLGIRGRNADCRAPTPEPAAPTPTPVTSVAVVSVPADETTVCCHEFPETLTRRVYPVLEQIEGVTRLERLTTNDGSVCYRFHYDGQPAVLENRLERDLRTSSTLSFRIERNRSTNMVDLVFDGGFD